jgi:N-acetylmuramoyl-L-alanine amidase
MRSTRLAVPLALGASLVAATPAAAHTPHLVAPGETLWGIASSHNFTTRSFAAANGLSPDAHILWGTTLRIPTVPEAAAALAKAAPASGAAPPSSPPPAAPVAPAPGAGAHTVRTGESLSSIAAGRGTSTARMAEANGLDPAKPILVGAVLKIPAEGSAPAPAPGAPAPLGSYTVRPGESLGAIAARSGVSVEQVAGANGLDPAKPLLVGTVLKLPAGAPRPSTPAPAPTTVPKAPPYPTPGRITAEEVKQVAAAHAVPPSVAAAVAWQESGFNNAAVSSANARGVMQILPGTWTWVQENLASKRLDPASPHDNVHAGTLYLQQLLRDTGGDVPTAVASYYQGLSSVRRNGMLPETRQYVNNVMALRSRFGG